MVALPLAISSANGVGLVAAVALLIYLFYAVARAERF
ncbi:MAG: K(+)-transporting ATPase subunit F [Solirubrobacteraceae bacterium]|nr:K(+)-transporting ATPase subunit F [Solirubrobacteraceae bacterium]